MSRPVLIVAGVFLAVLVFLAGAVLVGGTILLKRGEVREPATARQPGTTTPSAPPSTGRPVETIPVVYLVTGEGSARVTYTTGADRLTSGETVALPWRKTTQLPPGVKQVTLLAVVDGDPPDNFGCRITVGTERITDTSPDQNMVVCRLHR